jgi:large subunit ribosomal protein L19
MNAVEQFNARQIESLSKRMDSPIPTFRPGDVLRVSTIVQEVAQKDKKARERIQKFEGLCISRRNASVHSSFRIRCSVSGHSFEMSFKVYSPKIKKIEVVRCNKVRRSNLGYIRTLSRKNARLKERKSVSKAS